MEMAGGCGLHHITRGGTSLAPRQPQSKNDKAISKDKRSGTCLLELQHGS